MQDIQPWIDRLMESAPLLEVVEGLADYAANPVVRNPPQAWVIPAGRSSDGQRPTSLITEKFVILVAVREVSDPRSEAAVKTALKPVVEQIEQAYAGWMPPGDHWDGCLIFRGDGLYEIDNNRAVWWQMFYEITGLARPDLDDKVTC